MPGLVIKLFRARTCVSKEPSYLFASEITSGVAAVIGWLAEVSPGLTEAGSYFPLPASGLCAGRVALAKDLAVGLWFGVAGGACFCPGKGKHRKIFRGLNFIRERCQVSGPCPGKGCGYVWGSSVPVVPAAQKTQLSSRVWLAERSFPFGAGDCLQSLAVVKGGKFGVETRVCVWLAMPWFCCKMKFF